MPFFYSFSVSRLGPSRGKPGAPADTTRLLPPSSTHPPLTARAVWDRLLEREHSQLSVLAPADVTSSAAAYETAHHAAEAQGRDVFRELLSKHAQRIERERRKGTRAFEARRRALDRIGLTQVKQYRVSQLDKERQAWEERIKQLETALPELSAVLVVRIVRRGGAA